MMSGKIYRGGGGNNGGRYLLPTAIIYLEALISASLHHWLTDLESFSADCLISSASCLGNLNNITTGFSGFIIPYPIQLAFMFQAVPPQTSIAAILASSRVFADTSQLLSVLSSNQE